MQSLNVEIFSDDDYIGNGETGLKFYDLQHKIETRNKNIKITSNPSELATQLADDITAMVTLVIQQSHSKPDK